MQFNKEIFCTLGPSTLDKSFLKFSSGNVSLLRLNMSHVKISQLKRIIIFIRKFSKTPICIDTEGAQIRTKVKKKKKYKKNTKFFIHKQNGNFIIYPPESFNKLKKNDILDIGFDGLEIKVIKINKEKLYCKVLKDGLLENNKGIHLVNRRIILNFITKKLRIINLYNTGQKLNHRLYNISIGKKFTNGFIRNGHDVLEISDRDFIRQNRFLSINSNNKFQNYLLETFKNYNPDLFIFGHTKNINPSTIQSIRDQNKNLIISQWNEDPIMPSLDYSKKNLKNISIYSNIVDHNFITTDPKIAKQQKYDIKNLHFFFIPVDKNIECFDVFKMSPKKDLFYAMSHGVNRAVLKAGSEDSRVEFLDKLVKKYLTLSMIFMAFLINSLSGVMILIINLLIRRWDLI